MTIHNANSLNYFGGQKAVINSVTFNNVVKSKYEGGTSALSYTLTDNGELDIDNLNAIDCNFADISIIGVNKPIQSFSLTNSYFHNVTMEAESSLISLLSTG